MKAKSIFMKRFFHRRAAVSIMAVSTIMLALITGIAYTEAIRQFQENDNHEGESV